MDGETGFLCPLGDVDGMTAASRRLLTDPELHQRLAAGALARAEQFDIDEIVPQYEAYYQRVMDEQAEVIARVRP